MTVPTPIPDHERGMVVLVPTAYIVSSQGFPLPAKGTPADLRLRRQLLDQARAIAATTCACPIIAEKVDYWRAGLMAWVAVRGHGPIEEP